MPCRCRAFRRVGIPPLCKGALLTRQRPPPCNIIAGPRHQPLHLICAAKPPPPRPVRGSLSFCLSTPPSTRSDQHPRAILARSAPEMILWPVVWKARVPQPGPAANPDSQRGVEAPWRRHLTGPIEAEARSLESAIRDATHASHVRQGPVSVTPVRRGRLLRERREAKGAMGIHLPHGPPVE